MAKQKVLITIEANVECECEEIESKTLKKIRKVFLDKNDDGFFDWDFGEAAGCGCEIFIKPKKVTIEPM